MTTVKQLKVKLLDSPAVRAEYNALADEFDMAGELVAARDGLTQAEVAERMGTTLLRYRDFPRSQET